MTSHWESRGRRMPSWRHSVGISHLQPVNQSHVHVYTKVYLLSVLESERLLDSKRRTTTSTRFDLKFFRVLSKNRYPGMLQCTFFTRNICTVILIGGAQNLSRSLNDKTSNIWQIVSATTTFSLKLVVEWRWLPRFPTKMTLVHERAILSIEKISYS